MTDQQNTEAAEAQGPQFSLQRIYVRDLSFEAPKSPAIFRQEWTPSVALDLNTRQKALEGDFHEVVLTMSVTVKNGEEVAFIAEVQQAHAPVHVLVVDLKLPGAGLALGIKQQRHGAIDMLAVQLGFAVEPHHYAIRGRLYLLQFDRVRCGQPANHQPHHQADNRQRAHDPWQ